MTDVVDAVETGRRVVRFVRAVFSARVRDHLVDEWLDASPTRAAAMVLEGAVTLLVIAVLLYGLVAAVRAAA